MYMCVCLYVYKLMSLFLFRYRQIDRQIDRQIARQIDRQIGRQIDRQIERRVFQSRGLAAGFRVLRRSNGLRFRRIDGFCKKDSMYMCSRGVAIMSKLWVLFGLCVQGLGASKKSPKAFRVQGVGFRGSGLDPGPQPLGRCIRFRVFGFQGYKA